MSKLTLTLSQFAHDLGAHSRITREVSLVWHKQWLSADQVTRQALRDEFLREFIRGALGCKPAEAVRILTSPKGERTAAEQEAYMAASQKFKYHISRDGAKDAKPEPKSMRLSADARAAAKAYLAHFENVQDAIAALRAVAK